MNPTDPFDSKPQRCGTEICGLASDTAELDDDQVRLRDLKGLFPLKGFYDSNQVYQVSSR